MGPSFSTKSQQLSGKRSGTSPYQSASKTLVSSRGPHQQQTNIRLLITLTAHSCKYQPSLVLTLAHCVHWVSYWRLHWLHAADRTTEFRTDASTLLIPSESRADDGVLLPAPTASRTYDSALPPVSFDFLHTGDCTNCVPILSTLVDKLTLNLTDDQSSPTITPMPHTSQSATSLVSSRVSSLPNISVVTPREGSRSQIRRQVGTLALAFLLYLAWGPPGSSTQYTSSTLRPLFSKKGFPQNILMLSWPFWIFALVANYFGYKVKSFKFLTIYIAGHNSTWRPQMAANWLQKTWPTIELLRLMNPRLWKSSYFTC